MAADDAELLRFMASMVEDEDRAEPAGPEIVDPVSGLLRPEVVPHLRRLMRSGQIDARTWFAHLLSALAAFSREYVRTAQSGDLEALVASDSMERNMLGCELVLALADQAGSQVERAIEIVEQRGAHHALLFDAALAILARQRDNSPAGYARVKQALLINGCANREGKRIAHLAEYVEGEIDRLIAALEPGTGQTPQEFAIDVLEEHPGTARAVIPLLKTLASSRDTPDRTQSRAISALTTFAADGDGTREREVVEFLAPLAGHWAHCIQVYMEFGRLRRHPALTIPVLLRGLDNDDDEHYYDTFPDEEALSALNQYRAPADAQEILAEDVQTRTRRWQEGDEDAFRADYFDMLIHVASGPGPVLEALIALDVSVQKRAATIADDSGQRTPEVINGQRALERSIRKIAAVRDRG